MHAISKVRHEDKYKCVQLCIEKENQGFECIRPIRYVDHYHKNFRFKGKYIEYADSSDGAYYEAVYRKTF